MFRFDMSRESSFHPCDSFSLISSLTTNEAFVFFIILYLLLLLTKLRERVNYYTSHYLDYQDYYHQVEDVVPAHCFIHTSGIHGYN